MAGITIISAKVVGICSKCRRDGDEIPQNKDGSIIPDKDISCINAALGDSPCQEKYKVMSEKAKMDLRNLAFNFFRDDLAYTPYLNAMEKIFAKCTKDEEVKE